MIFSDDLVSVVIPVYNSEKFLVESIESVLNQTYENIEIITIDDGSTDSSSDILQRYSDKIIVLSQKNQGLASALKAGIDKMNGKWFKWFSPDDVLYHNAIEVLVNEIKKLPVNTIVYSNWELIDENGKKIRNFSESNYNDLESFEFNVRLLDGQQINVNSTLIPISLFEKGCVLGNLEDLAAIDYDFFLRAGILYNTKFHLIQEQIVKYRIHNSQLSHKNISQTLSYLETIRKDILSNLENDKKNQYRKALLKYTEEKTISRKTMEKSLKFTTYVMPNWITDKILLFYLNKLRRTR